MFTSKNKTEMSVEKSNSGNGTTLIGAGTTLKGDINSSSDLRIDGTIIGNIHSTAKVVIGANGVVEGNISGNQADIIGKVSGNVKAKDLLQLRSDATVTGNLYAGKLQIEPSAVFNGECHMGTNVVEMSGASEQKQIAKQVAVN
jgi:cytoskeletal protein CcmA (bactofilin family)